MSPTSSNPSSSSSSSRGAPYARRPSGQPKSSRQQFSACGACRMRRVRCDLKDLPVPLSGPNPACSNCRERGLKCVDEFADVKAVKLLRRGRRLQQVEAIYGKASSCSSNGDDSGLSTPRPSAIPNLHPDFFSSSFWSWLSIQRPVLDPVEFPARYTQAQSQGQTLSAHTTIISMLLVLWAFSYGLDEHGLPIASSPGPMSSRKGRTQSMLREILELLDIHAIMRSPTWDGLRILLLLQPLVDEDDSVHPLDRVALRDASLSQVISLSSLSLSSAAHPEDHAAVRTRLFWCAYIQESVTAGLRGGRLFLTTDDLDLLAPVPSVPLTPSSLNFTNLNLFTPPSYGNGYSNHLPSPISPTFPPNITPPMSSRNSSPLGSSTPLSLSSPDSHLFATPLRLSTLIRKAHRIILSPKASKTIQANGGIVDAVALGQLWKGLDSCWEELASIRKTGHGVEIEKWTSAWQLIIFECHNLIKESLKQLARTPSSPVSPTPNSPGSLYEMASRKCFRLLPSILSVVKYNLSYEVTDLFRYDTGLVRDGLFYAAYLSATISSSELVDYVTSVQLKSESVDDPTSSSYNVVGFGVEEVRPGLLPILDSDEGVNVCLAAMSEMRWTLSNGVSGKGEREDLVGLVKSVWEARKGQGLGPNGFSPPYPFAQSVTGVFYGMDPTPDTSLDGMPVRYLSGPSSSSTSSGGSPHSDPGHPHLVNSMTTPSLGELPYSSTNSRSTYIPSISHHSQSNHSSPSSTNSLQLGYSSHPSPHQLQSHSSPHLQTNHSQHPVLPPLTLTSLVRGGPNTAPPELGNGNGVGWGDYTPPGTAGSGAGSPGVGGFKSEVTEADFYAHSTGYGMEFAT